MSKYKPVRFENWKRGRVIIRRTKEGKIDTWRYQKGSGISSIKQAEKQYSKTQTFRINVLRVKSQVKPTNIKVEQQTTLRQIGKNTGVISSKRPIRNKDYYQYVASVTFGNSGTVLGYSNLISQGGTKKQAFERAYAEASSLNIVDYDEEPNWVNSNTGFVQKGNTTIYFHVEYSVLTYIKTKENPQYA